MNHEFRDEFARGSRSITNPFHSYSDGRSQASSELADVLRVQELADFQTNDRISEAPTEEIALQAAWLVAALRRIVQNDGGRWRSPHITASEDGEITFEWWLRDRKLAIYCDGTRVLYLKVWGPNIDTQMEDGLLDSISYFRQIWNWLHV